MGIAVQMAPEAVIIAIKEGFGGVLRSIGLIIVLGTTLGILLEYTRSTHVMAGFILKRVGESSAAAAMSATGFLVGLPIFCDSGYIVLSGLNNALSRRTGISMAIMSVSLATGLYSVHCLIPPHPGAAAAAGIVGVDFGRLILWGVIIALPATIVGYAWANYAGRRLKSTPDEGSGKERESEKQEESGKEDAHITHQPSIIRAVLPVLVPIVLIGLRSFMIVEKNATDWTSKILSILGEPVIALAVGIVLAFNCKRKWMRKEVSTVLQEGAEKAGGILVIIGAGGAFGAVLAATKIGEHFSESVQLGNLGFLFPFLLAFILKTAQGSSTVAIITAASIIHPLLPALGLNTEDGKLLAVLSMGAGSMMISHANDAYFWVIAKFSGLEMKPMIKVYSAASILMGIVSLVMIFLLSKVF